MRNRSLTAECNKIFNFWKLEEYFTPSDYPELTLTIKEGKQDIPFDAYYNAYSTRSLPLKEYKAHNEYLIQKHKSDEKLYNRANVYCGCYKIKTFVEKMAEKCKLDMEKYAEINELSGRFYIFSVQIDLDGKLTEEGVQVSPFFYAVLCMIKAEGINVNIMQENIWKLNEEVNEILKQNNVQILEFTDVTIVKNIIFDKLRIESESEVGLKSASDKVYACKGLKKEDETSDFTSFYLDEIENVQKNYKNNENLIKYTTSLLAGNQKKIMIDSDVCSMKKWLEVDRFPMGKYPSKFSPTLMQQIAINIAISENDRKEKIFSVNGPPGTGKTTLLKEIIASNVVQLAEVLIKYGISGSNFVPRKVESTSNARYTEKYYEIPEEISKYGILVVSNNNGAVENITLDLPKSGDMEKDKTRTDYFDRKINKEVYFSAVADNLLGKEGGAWGLISARMGRKSYVTEVLESCVFAKKNDASDKVTLDLAREDSISWDEAIDKFNVAKRKVLLLREGIKKDQKLLDDFYKEGEGLAKSKLDLKQLLIEKEQLNIKLNDVRTELESNEQETLEQEGEIKYIKEHSSIFKKLLILLGIGKIGRHVAEKQKYVDELIINHEDIKRRYSLAVRNTEEVCGKIENQYSIISTLEKKVQILEEKVYGNNESLKNKYKNNFADRNFYEASAQTFADNINEFNGMIGERQVGCPLVVHRRCIEPMFSISNLISYDNRMFNKTNKKEEYLKPENPFLIKKSGWINVEGVENGGKNHFVKNQAERVCQLMEDAVHIYSDLFETDDKIFIITPFRTVAESMRKFIISYFSAKGYDKEILSKWTKNCVGTVHTFQGKDANEVLLVLGCSNKSAGAMNWVVKKANILNVACTRAKYRIAFIGNINDWKNRRYFREFIPNLIDIINV